MNPDKAIYNGAIPGCSHAGSALELLRSQVISLLREEQRGKYYGVGMQVAPRNNKVIVMAPFAGAPAYNAGIRPGDVIMPSTRKPPTT